MTTVIYYPGGAYGTFIEWILTFLTDANFDDTLPFGRKGNSHKFAGNFIGKKKALLEKVLNNSPRFARTHPDYFTISELLDMFDNVVDVTLTDESKFWIWNNINSKVKVHDMDDRQIDYLREYDPTYLKIIQREDEDHFRYFLERSDSLDFLKGYGVNDTSELERWQLREILSFWDFREFQPNYFNFKPHQGQRIFNISVEALRDDLPRSIISLANTLELDLINSRVDRLDEIWNEWGIRQDEKDKDQLINDYINGAISKSLGQYPRFNIFEEAWIQQRLRGLGYEIRCDKLDYLPSSTIEMNDLIYEHSTDTERT